MQSDTSPFSQAAAIVPSDTEPLALKFVVRGLYVGTAGTVSLVPAGQNEAVSFNAPAGAIIPAFIKQVKATGTTASGLVALGG